MRPAEVVELEVDEAERIGALARVSRSHPGARGCGISKPQCVTGNASPPPNFEGRCSLACHHSGLTAEAPA